MVIILNDNDVHPAQRRCARSLFGRKSVRVANTRVRADSVQSVLEASGPLGRGLVDLGRNAKDPSNKWSFQVRCSSKSLASRARRPFPVTISLRLRALRVCLEADGPTLLHVVTKKGKGLNPPKKTPANSMALGHTTSRRAK